MNLVFKGWNFYLFQTLNGTFARHEASISIEFRFPVFQIVFESSPSLGRYTLDLAIELVAVSIGSV
jgi:hypothetical protein